MTKLKQSAADKLLNIFQREFGVSTQKECTSLNLAAWDSVSHINLIFELEETFGIDVPSSDIKGLHSDFDSVLRYVVLSIERE